MAAAGIGIAYTTNVVVLMLVDPVLALCCCLPASWVVREVMLW